MTACLEHRRKHYLVSTANKLLYPKTQMALHASV